jgi:hypothetical protein
VRCVGAPVTRGTRQCGTRRCHACPLTLERWIAVKAHSIAMAFLGTHPPAWNRGILGAGRPVAEREIDMSSATMPGDEAGQLSRWASNPEGRGIAGAFLRLSLKPAAAVRQYSASTLTLLQAAADSSGSEIPAEECPSMLEPTP